MTNKEQIKEYIRDQIAQADFRAQGYVFDAQNKKRLNRNIFIKLQSHLNKFLEGNKAFRWVALTGLRGAGKTTIMYQLYHAKKSIDAYFLILPVDVLFEKNKNHSLCITLHNEPILYNLGEVLYSFPDGELRYCSE